MKHRRLGASGLRVSELCFGVMTFGRETNPSDGHSMLDAFVDAGGTFIDTADIYTRGRSEEILGDWLKNKRREDFVVATKVRFPMGEGPNDTGLNRQHILTEVENSLRRLKTDYIDLYQVHCWDPSTPLEETLSTLNDLQRQGKVRYIGASNFLPYQLQKAIDISRHEGWEAFSTLQPLYNLLVRTIEWELVEICQSEGLGILPWSPLGGGWLTGKFRRGDKEPVANTRVESTRGKGGWYESWSNYANDHTWNVLDALRDIAQSRGKSIAQVALNWVKDQPGVCAPLIGARNLTQLTDNLGAVGWELSGEERKRLTEISEVVPPYYPYRFIREATSH